MNNTLSPELSAYLLEKRFTNFNDVKTKFSIEEDELEDLLMSLQDQYQKVGIILEVLDFDDQTYIVLTKQLIEEDSYLSSRQLTVLGLIALVVKAQGNQIPQNEFLDLFSDYQDEISCLLNEDLITKMETDELIFKLTPLGAVIISPLLEEIESILINEEQ